MFLGDIPGIGPPSPVSIAQAGMDIANQFASGNTTGGILSLLLGDKIGSLLGGLFVKPSNDTAYIWFTPGAYPVPMVGGVQGKNCTGNVCGDESTSQTKQFGQQISDALFQIIQGLEQHGITFNSPAFVVTVGGRDGAGILKADHSGSWYKRNIAAVGDGQGTIMAVMNWLAQFANPPLSSFQGGAMTGQPNTIMYQQPPGTVPPPSGVPANYNAQQAASAADPSATQASAASGFDLSAFFGQYGVYIIGGVGVMLALVVVSSLGSDTE